MLFVWAQHLALSVHCLCIVCALSVHCLCIVCVLSVHCLCIVCALSVYCLCIVCALFVLFVCNHKNIFTDVSYTPHTQIRMSLSVTFGSNRATDPANATSSRTPRFRGRAKVNSKTSASLAQLCVGGPQGGYVGVGTWSGRYLGMPIC